MIGSGMTIALPELLLLGFLFVLPVLLVALLVWFLVRGGQAKRVQELEQRVAELEIQRK